MLDSDRVRTLVDRHIRLEGLSLGRTRARARGAEAVLEDAIDNCCEQLTKERLTRWYNDLHFAGSNFPAKSVRANWRDDDMGPMYVRSTSPTGQVEHFEAPPAERLNNEMENFITWFNSQDDTDGVLRASVAHLWFVTIHPFPDGNGRIARAITDMTLARTEGMSYWRYRMSHQLVKEGTEYYLALERTQRGTLDITNWILWFLQCYERSIDRSEAALSGVFAEARFWRTYERSQFNKCQLHILDWLFANFGNSITVGMCAAIAKCNHETAYRDVTDLVARDILAHISGCERSACYQLV